MQWDVTQVIFYAPSAPAGRRVTVELTRADLERLAAGERLEEGTVGFGQGQITVYVKEDASAAPPA